MENSQIKLYFAPIQGITDYLFRNLYQKYFGSIDKYFTPYLKLEEHKPLKESKLKDVLPENNGDVPVVPQIMTKSPGLFIDYARKLKDMGYEELNWNLGCPYPMVTKRGLGAGMLPNPDIVTEILDKVLPKIGQKLSLKIRLGMESKSETECLIPMLNEYPISELMIHPRLAADMYKGQADFESFIHLSNLSTHKLCYNGDIDSIERFMTFQEKSPGTSNWMIGRGAIANPFLAQMIKKNQPSDQELCKMQFFTFHDALFEANRERLSGDAHVLQRMTNYWEYFSKSFRESAKWYKKIRKASSASKYQMIMLDIFRGGEWLVD